MTIDDIKAKASELYDDDSCSCVVFTKGALWRIESVWHEKYEEPEDVSRLLLIELNNGEFILGYEFEYKETVRWAYLDDLMPED